MPPRSKQHKSEWVKCELCNCNISNRDLNNHREICCDETPFSVRSVDLASLQHGFSWKYILCALATIAEEAQEHLTSSQADQLIHINPVTMRLCDVQIGGPVVVDQQHVLLAWPAPSAPLATVRLSAAAMSRILKTSESTNKKQKETLLVTGFTQPYVPAKELILRTKTPSDWSGDYNSKEFKQYVSKQTNGKFLTAGSSLNLTYYGHPCHLFIKAITGENSTCSLASSSEGSNTSRFSRKEKDDKPSSGLADSLSQLQIEPRVVNLTSLSQPTFYKITTNTQMKMESESKVKKPQENPGIKLDSIGGLDTQISTIVKTMDTYFSDTDLFQRLSMPAPHGILLHGPSGCGKTMLGKAVALHNCSKHVVTINSSEIWSKYYGESEAKLARYFQEAKDRSPSVVFIDELDALCPKRESSHNEVEKRVVAALLNHLGELEDSKQQVFVIATTNKLDSIDPALRRPGRFDKEIELGVPSAADRAEILFKLLKVLLHNISKEQVKAVADQAHGFVGADLAAVCKEAAVLALKQASGAKQQILLSEANLVQGLRSVQPSAMRELALEIPQVKWEDIGGQKELKHKLKQAIEWPLKHPEAFQRLGIRPPRGLLMYGPPGCSKTMIAKALARESGINFIAIKGPELFSKWVGESERAVRELFRKARAAAPAIIFFDEIDALAGERGSHGGGGAGDVSDRVLAQLLTEMDGVVALQDVTIVAATNRPDRIDKALLRPGRLDRIVYVPLPDENTRSEILQISFRKTPVAADVEIDELVARTQGYSGAEVTAVCREAALCAMQEDINIETVHKRHFDHALKVVTPRISDDLLQFYENYQQTSGLHSV